MAATLRRTALYDSHVAKAGAKLVEFAAGRCPAVRGACGAEHMAVREACGILRSLAHGTRSKCRGAGASRCFSACVRTTSSVGRRARRRRRPVQQCSAARRRRARRLFHVPPRNYRLLTVTTRPNHVRDLQWFQAMQRSSRGARHDGRRYAMICRCRGRGRMREEMRERGGIFGIVKAGVSVGFALALVDKEISGVGTEDAGTHWTTEPSTEEAWTGGDAASVRHTAT